MDIMIGKGVPLGLGMAILLAISFCFKRNRMIIFWLFACAWIHLLWDGGYVLTHTTVNKVRNDVDMEKWFAEKTPLADVFTSKYWQQTLASDGYAVFAQYDRRYAESDPVVRYLAWTEIWFLGGMCLLTIWAMAVKSKWEHPLMIVLSVSQLYGTVAYFGIPYVAGNFDCFITDFWPAIKYIWVLNGLWILIPGLLIIRSSRILVWKAQMGEKYLEAQKKSADAKKTK